MTLLLIWYLIVTYYNETSNQKQVYKASVVECTFLEYVHICI